MKYNLKITRQLYPNQDDPEFCVHRKVTAIQFANYADAEAYGMKLAKSMATPNNEEDAYFLNRGFEMTLPNGKAYEVGFHDYSMCITPHN